MITTVKTSCTFAKFFEKPTALDTRIVLAIDDLDGTTQTRSFLFVECGKDK